MEWVTYPYLVLTIFPTITWWRHQMEIFPALLALCAGNSPFTGEFPTQRTVTRSLDTFFDMCLNKGWVNNREADDWRRHWAHNDVIVMSTYILNYSSRYIEWKCNYWRPQDELRCSPCWWHSNNWCVVSPYFNERYQMAQLRFTGDMADRNCVLHYQANMDMVVIMAT